MKSGVLQVDDFLKQMAERLQIPNADIVSVDDTAYWPDGKLGELIKAGILTEIEHGKGVICDQCEENCYIEPDIRTNPDISPPAVAGPEDLPIEWQVEFEERAAILEYDGGLSRDEADAQAFREITERLKRIEK